jgi:hypothetical protein
MGAHVPACGGGARSAGNDSISSHGSLAQCPPTLVRSDSFGGPSLTTIRPKATVATGAGLADAEPAPAYGAWSGGPTPTSRRRMAPSKRSADWTIRELNYRTGIRLFSKSHIISFLSPEKPFFGLGQDNRGEINWRLEAASLGRSHGDRRRYLPRLFLITLRGKRA